MGAREHPHRRFDVLILDYAGVCTLSHVEYLQAAYTDERGERSGCLAAIEDARAVGARVVILSNEIDRSWIPDSPVLSAADDVLACADNGIFKPDRRAFQRAALLANCPADRTLVVDDEEHNLRGAEAAGMATLLFDTSNPDASWTAIGASLRGA